MYVGVTFTVMILLYEGLPWLNLSSCVNIDVHLFIRSATEARLSFPFLVCYYLNCRLLKCTKTFSLLNIVC